mgnify:CR=1 FL=1
MARELYNWDQVRAYALIGLNNLLKTGDKNNIDLKKFKRELDPLQTSFGKEGVVGYANRLLNKE